MCQHTLTLALPAGAWPKGHGVCLQHAPAHDAGTLLRLGAQRSASALALACACRVLLDARGPMRGIVRMVCSHAKQVSRSESWSTGHSRPGGTVLL